jgi:hypothetical protein
MNARRFFYLAAGVLCLTMAFAVGRMTAEGPTSAVAGYVDHASCGAVAVWAEDDHEWALDEFGQVWQVERALGGWYRHTEFDPPVPVSEIKFWMVDGFITVDNEFLSCDRPGWSSFGFWPGAPSPAGKTTWSKVKADFR